MNPDVERLHRLSKQSLTVVERNGASQLDTLAGLIEEIETIITKYIALPYDALTTLIAVWIVHTYCYESFQYSGYLALRSPTPRCGKSRLLRVIAMLAKDSPPITATPTAATLFRSTRKVLILDEVDRLRNQDKEMFGDVLAVLNLGFERGAVIERTEKSKNGYVVKAYDVFYPKAIAGIERLADALADRCFQIRMERTTKRMPRLNTRRLESIAGLLRLRLDAWATVHHEDVRQAYDGLPDELPSLEGFDDRLQDISEPLVVLASTADAERPDGPAILPKLLVGLKAVAGRREPLGRERELLALLEVVKEKLDGAAELFVSTDDLLMLSQDREELSRLETGRALAGFLRHFDLLPGRGPSNLKRGYWLRRDWLSHWEERYRTETENGG